MKIVTEKKNLQLFAVGAPIGGLMLQIITENLYSISFFEV